MLKIDKKIPKNLIDDYVNTVIDYIKQKRKNINKKDIEALKCILSAFNFRDIYYKLDNKTRNRIEKIFKTKKKEKSLWDKLRDIVVKKVNSTDDDKTDYKTVKDLLGRIQIALGINICPYCGENHIDIIELSDEVDEFRNNKGKVVRNRNKNVKIEKKSIVPCIDHFFMKSKYPFFQLSLYNLVPSCYRCNTNCKSTNEVENKKCRLNIINPYIEGFEDNVLFNFKFSNREEQVKMINALSGSLKNIEKLDIILVNKDLSEIEIEDTYSNSNSDNVKGKKDYLDRCRKSNDIFHIEKLYNQAHKQNAKDLIKKIVWFKENYFKTTNSVFHSNDIEIILKNDFDYLLGSWLIKENDLKIPYSKFYRDIYNQIRHPDLYYTPLVK